MFVRFVKRNPSTIIGLVIVCLVVVVTVMAPVLAPYSPTVSDLDNIRKPPSAQYWLGTDNTGMDVFSRLVYATRVDIVIALGATILAVVCGTLLGISAGYLRGIGSEVILRLADIVQSFPVFVLGMALVGVFGPNMFNLMAAIAFLNTLVYLQLTYNEALVTRERAFIEAAKCCGVSEVHILIRHILPNSIRAVLTLISVRFGSMVLLTAGLSFIGAGVRPPTAEWGAMVAEGAQNIFTGEWWIAVFPGIAIVIVVTGFALLGEGLRKFFDPQMRDL